MIFNRPLDYILSSYSHIAVLRTLQYAKIGMTGREISRNAKITAKSALNALTNLEKLKIVRRQIGGRDHIFTLNYDHYLVAKGILPLLSAEANFLKDLMTVVRKKFGKQCESIIIFGSVAKKEERFDSDIDICFIVPEAKNKKELETEIHDGFNLISEKFGATLAGVIYTIDEFRRKAKKNAPPIKDIIKEGILISGKTVKQVLHGKADKKS